MNVAIFSTHNFEREYLERANKGQHNFKYLSAALSMETVNMAGGCEAIAIFVGDDASASVLNKLNAIGVRFLTLRSAGFNHVNLDEVKRLKMKAARVSEYSPYAVAEHAIALMLALNRTLIRSHSRILEYNFSLDGLTGFDMHGKTVGIIGTGNIGSVVAKILNGFGCRILAYDIVENEKIKNIVEYTTLENIYAHSDIISLHVPLNDQTKYMINATSLNSMKPGIMLINTSRGKLINTIDIIQALKSRHIGYLGIDVYEKEEGLFFEDHSEKILQDDIIARLMTFKNVLITGHHAFLTDTALKNIADTTVENLNCFYKNIAIRNSNSLV